MSLLIRAAKPGAAKSEFYTRSSLFALRRSITGELFPAKCNLQFDPSVIALIRRSDRGYSFIKNNGVNESFNSHTSFISDELEVEFFPTSIESEIFIRNRKNFKNPSHLSLRIKDSISSFCYPLFQNHTLTVGSSGFDEVELSGIEIRPRHFELTVSTESLNLVPVTGTLQKEGKKINSPSTLNIDEEFSVGNVQFRVERVTENNSLGN